MTEQDEVQDEDTEQEPTLQTVVDALSELSSRSAMGQRQITQVYDAVAQLWNGVSSQSEQVEQTRLALSKELQQYQTAGPQKAMASVFFKLMRDLVAHIASLDELVELGQTAQRQEVEQPWIDAIRVFRDNLEATLATWNCNPIATSPGDEFAPEIHYAVPVDPDDDLLQMAENVIVKVRSRGWSLQGEIIQHPKVVVNCKE